MRKATQMIKKLALVGAVLVAAITAHADLGLRYHDFEGENYEGRSGWENRQPFTGHIYESGQFEGSAQGCRCVTGYLNEDGSFTATLFGSGITWFGSIEKDGSYWAHDVQGHQVHGYLRPIQ
jgi:hypothetical protein